jgi:hypothetical protein
VRRLIALVVVLAISTTIAYAVIENSVFSSTKHDVRVGIPRGWRGSDQATYPGVLLWMRRSRPPGLIMLSSEQIDDAIYCSWPPECRSSSDQLSQQYACALVARLAQAKFRVGPVQAGPKDGKLPSVWFEYDDGRRWLRQAIATDDARAHSLVLSATSQTQRANHVRSFEQALRTLRSLSEEEAEEAIASPPDAAPPDAPPRPDADPSRDAGPAPVDAAPPDAPPADPVGVLTRRCR